MENSGEKRLIGEFNGGDSTANADASCSAVRTSFVRHSSVSGGSGLTERLSEVLVDDRDGVLLLQRDRREDNLLQWLQLLDVQVMGACRSDERLKPLLKLNASAGATDDLLLSQLNQHFEPLEVGLLARCLCAPLVSIRVGKVIKQGILLCPTSARGSLNLVLLPTSDLRILFLGDDGSEETLATLSSDEQCSALEIEKFVADMSGRSFAIKVPRHKAFYFWCSEKCNSFGIELLRKMRDLLKYKPSLADVTGISESRLDSFAANLRACIVGSTVANTCERNALSATKRSNRSVASSEFGVDIQLSVRPLKSSRRYRHNSSQGVKIGPFCQGGLGPRPNPFKESLPSNLSSKAPPKEKLKQLGDNYSSRIGSITGSSASAGIDDKYPEPIGALPSMFAPSFLRSSEASINGLLSSPAAQFPEIGEPVLYPYYISCPPVSLITQYVPQSLSPIAPLYDLASVPLSLPINCSLPHFLMSKPPLSLNGTSFLDLPPLLPEPLVRFPLSLQSAQQIPSFTPLMCDPIVHIPVIDVCSSGQGYLVSAGPTLSAGIPPLCPNVVAPLISEAGSVVEKGARETLRLLLSRSTHSNPPMMDLLPSILTENNINQSILAAGSRSLYIGARDVNMSRKSVSAVGLAYSPSENYTPKKCTVRDIRDQYSYDPSGSSPVKTQEEKPE